MGFPPHDEIHQAYIYNQFFPGTSTVLFVCFHLFVYCMTSLLLFIITSACKKKIISSSIFLFIIFASPGSDCPLSTYGYLFQYSKAITRNLIPFSNHTGQYSTKQKGYRQSISADIYSFQTVGQYFVLFYVCL